MADPSGVVLVISDDDGILQDAKFGFPAGVEVVTARDGREASRSIETMVPSVAVVEIRTGSAGGFNFARTMRQRASTGDVPILMILERAQDEWLAQQAGANKTCIQPVETSELVAETLALIPDTSTGDAS